MLCQCWILNVSAAPNLGAQTVGGCLPYPLPPPETQNEIKH